MGWSLQVKAWLGSTLLDDRKLLPLGEGQPVILGGKGPVGCHQVTLPNVEAQSKTLLLPNRLCLLRRDGEGWWVHDLTRKRQSAQPVLPCIWVAEADGSGLRRVDYEGVALKEGDHLVVAAAPGPSDHGRNLLLSAGSDPVPSEVAHPPGLDMTLVSSTTFDTPKQDPADGLAGWLEEMLGARLLSVDDVNQVIREWRIVQKVQRAVANGAEDDQEKTWKQYDDNAGKETGGRPSGGEPEEPDKGAVAEKSGADAPRPTWLKLKRAYEARQLMLQDGRSLFRYMVRRPASIPLPGGGWQEKVVQLQTWAAWRTGVSLGDASSEGITGNFRTHLVNMDQKSLQEFGVIPLERASGMEANYWGVLDPFDADVRSVLRGRWGSNEQDLILLGGEAFQRFFDQNREQRQAHGHPFRKESEVFSTSGASSIPDGDMDHEIAQIIGKARTSRASDIHIEFDGQDTVVRIRVDGVMTELARYQKKHHQAIVSYLKIKAGMDVTEKRRPQDGRIQLHNADVRASTFPTEKHEKFVLRLLETKKGMSRTGELGMQANDLAILRRHIRNPSGLVLICGPTGSGKTSTLYACLSELNKIDRNIMTIEDPVEYKVAGINQMQVRTDIDVTFAKGLRTILRQDPDIVMVGEIRDEETLGTALEASLTGHLVFSTIHTNSAPETVNRLIEMKAEPFLINAALSLSVSQRLVRILCDTCQENVSGMVVQERLEADGVNIDQLAKTHRMTIPVNGIFPQAVRGRRCEKCNGTGYAGRKAIFETFEINHAVRDLILTRESSPEKLWQALRPGLWDRFTIAAHARYLVYEAKQTTFQEVVRVLGY